MIAKLTNRIQKPWLDQQISKHTLKDWKKDWRDELIKQITLGKWMELKSKNKSNLYKTYSCPVQLGIKPFEKKCGVMAFP